MKKNLIIICICATFVLMPAITALPTTTKTSQSSIIKSPLSDYDGTFVGGLGTVWKDGGEWKYEVQSYIAGVYRNRNNKELYGNIYNLEKEQIGTLTIISTKSFLVGRITDMEDHKAPIVGFIFDYNENNFIGRLMSLFGPAPHMWGKYTPNE